jgi:hypothetical protein
MAVPDYASVVADARTALDQLLSNANATSPYAADGTPTIDLSSLDRRSLFAISSNANGQFSTDEQSLATQSLQDGFDAAMAGPDAVARVTGNIDGLYTAAAAYLDAASPEEKASNDWAVKNTAVTAAQKQIASDPTAVPNVPNDPVVDFLSRTETGNTGQLRDFSAVASDARAALDAQYSAAQANGKQLVFSGSGKNGQLVDFSSFDSRSLSAVALNQDNLFSADEVSAASKAIKSRSNALLLSSFQSAAAGSDFTAFSQNIISAYGSMSSEERQAVGWTDSFYNTVVQSYQSSAKIASMFTTSTGSSPATTLIGAALSNSNTSDSFFGSTNSSASTSDPMSLLSYL